MPTLLISYSIILASQTRRSARFWPFDKAQFEWISSLSTTTSRSIALRSIARSTSPLNIYIAQHASQDEKRNVFRTFLYLDDGVLRGYYTLANSAVALTELSDEMAKKMPRYPMPAVLLSRLAVDKRMQGKGLGKRLMADFFRRVYAISKHSGVAFMVIDAKDQSAADFYEKTLGFTPSPLNRLRLIMPTAKIFPALLQQEMANA